MRTAKPAMAENPYRISVCMIVKNEEEMLPAALRSIKDLADEIVVVDTGSTDKTVEIAESFGAKVHRHPWEKDFSKHRNQSIDYATGDWIFIIDADEELEREGVPLLKGAVRSGLDNVITIPVYSKSTAGHDESTHNSIRLFKNGVGVRYEGAVHNELNVSGAALFIAAPLLHHGYALSREKMIAKFHRTTEILNKERAGDPENPRWAHYLAVSYFTEKLYPEAFEFARQSLELCGDDVEKKLRWLPNYYFLAAVRLQLNDFESAERMCREALEIFENYLDAWAILTSVAFKTGNGAMLTEAVANYLRLHDTLLVKPTEFSTVPLYTTNHRHLVLLRLALSFQADGDEAAFRKYYKEALKFAADPAELVISAAKYHSAKGHPDEALRLLDQGLAEQSGNTELFRQKVELLLSLKAFDRAGEALLEAPSKGIDSRTVNFLKGISSLLAGSYEEALAFFSDILSENPEDVDALTNLGVAYERLGEHEEAESCYLEAIDISPEKLDAAINLGNLYVKMGRNEHAIAFLEQVTLADDNLDDVHLLLARLYLVVEDPDKLLSRGRHVGRRLDIPGSDSADSVAELGRIFLDAGEIFSSRGNANAMALAFEMAHTLLPDNPAAQLRYGQTLLMKGGSNMAKILFDRAFELSPLDPAIYIGLASEYKKLGDDAKAELCEERAKSLTGPGH